jgi:hypothetical protein
MTVELKASQPQVEIGGQTELTVSISGGTPPYLYAGNDPGLNASLTTGTVLRCTVTPASTETYQVEVKDSRGQRRTATTKVTVVETGKLALRAWANPPQVTRGQTVALHLAIHGGKAPFTLHSPLPDFHHPSTTETAFQSNQAPSETTTYTVSVTDAAGVTASASIPVTVSIPHQPQLSAEGPLSQALIELWEKARSDKVAQIEKLVIRLFDHNATWKLHQALATLRDATVSCSFDVDLSADGIDTFQVEFSGLLSRANALKSFLDPQLKAATEHQLTATYTVEFTAPLSTSPDQTEILSRNLTKYGSGEAFVEAHAAPMERTQ